MKRAQLFFSPHPDDICIAAGALARARTREGFPATMILITDGSEARMPPCLLDTPREARLAPAKERGRIRVRESQRESDILGFAGLRLAPAQSWFTRHRTPAEALDEAGCLLLVDRFRPGPITDEAIGAVREVIAEHMPCDVFMPWISDKLLMHRISAWVVLEAVLGHCRTGQVRLACYETLSTLAWPDCRTVDVEPRLFGFDEELMRVKQEAIAAHVSQHLRRSMFGGYSSGDPRSYGARVTEMNRREAERHGHAMRYVERYVAVHDPHRLSATMRADGMPPC